MPATITVLDSAGATQTVNTLPGLGAAAAAASLPVTTATDDPVQAKLGIVTETAPATDTASSGLNGRLQRIAQRITSMIAQLPAALGSQTSAASLSVVHASDDALIGIKTETAPASDTASSGLNGRLQRLAQNVTSLIGKFPSAIGQTTKAASLSVALASDDAAVTALGTTADAAVANAAAGTALGYLRSIKDAATDTTTASPVSAPALTKGTQAVNGFSVQDLKDAGRNTIALTSEFAFAQTAETLLTMTLSQNGGATTTFTSRVITSGKKFRVTAMHMEVESLGSGTAPQRAYLRLRVNTAGATTTSSPLQAVFSVGVTTAIVKATEKGSIEFPEGLEFNGDGTATFGLSLETPDWVTTTATGRAKITVVGYEY